MSANINMASSHVSPSVPPSLSSSAADAHPVSTFDRAVNWARGVKTGDLVINAMWVAFAAYGLAATVNVLLTY